MWNVTTRVTTARGIYGVCGSVCGLRGGTDQPVRRARRDATATAMLPILLLLLSLLLEVATGEMAVPPRRIDVHPDSDGRLQAGQIMDALSQARAMLAAKPADDVLIQLPPGEFALNTTGIPFELSNIAPASGHSWRARSGSG